MRFPPFAVICLSVVFSFGQEARWEWTPAAEHHNAVVAVESNGNGTGVIVGLLPDKLPEGRLGHCLTACHLTVDVETGAAFDGNYVIRYRNGRSGRFGSVVSRDAENDIAVLKVWVPDGVEPARVSDSVKAGDVVEFVGLGGSEKDASVQKSLRHFRGVASGPTDAVRIYADLCLLPGDSGGPVFNQNNEIVGIISGGWFWFKANEKTTTWPARAANGKAIRKLLEGIK